MTRANLNDMAMKLFTRLSHALTLSDRVLSCPSMTLVASVLNAPKGSIIALGTTYMNRCKSCMKNQDRSFHSTGADSAKNTKRVIIKPVTFKPKSSKKEVIVIHPSMTVEELAAALNKDVDHVFEAFLHVPNSDPYDSPKSVVDDISVIKGVVEKSGFRWRIETVEKKVEKPSKDVEKQPAPDPRDLVKRPPIVTIMGHVDHGKTTLLDALRHSHIVDQEFGGITQHIGAFSVTLSTGESITFLDTPGHAAFSAMRYRGSHITDIVVLVVAADDGVMKQTVESIRHAQDAQVPIIVAINKMDKPEASVERVRRGLLEHGIHFEDMGGEIQYVPISALKGTNLDALQETIVTLAEVLELKGCPTGWVEGMVLESRTDSTRGKVVTVLVQRGTLRKADYLVAGLAWGKVRNLFNDRGEPVSQAGPGVAVEVLGWRDLPAAGDELQQVDSEKRAHEVLIHRRHQQMDQKAADDLQVVRQVRAQHDEEYHELRQKKLDSGRRKDALYRKRRTKEEIATSTGAALNIVLKGDVDGSVEAILDVLDTYQSNDCRLEVLSYGVGPVSEHDVAMAEPFKGVIYSFNTVTLPSAHRQAKDKGVAIKPFKVIYHLFDDLREELEKRLPTKEVETVLGEANVVQLFLINDGKHKLRVGGARCVKGALHRKKMFKLVRAGETLLTGSLSSLKHFKQEVELVKTDVECGLLFEDQTIEPQPGDTVICYELTPVKSKLNWKLDF